MRVVFDLDGTICEQMDPKGYMFAKPDQDMVDFINDLYVAGHYIIIFTARGMGTNNGNMIAAYEQWYTLTELQLKNWGLRYHELQLGKPNADLYIDDKAFRMDNNLDELKKLIKDKTNGS